MSYPWLTVLDLERNGGKANALNRGFAAAMLVRNSRFNLVTKMQEWDYFHGIAAIKRIQSLYHGTLVAQLVFLTMFVRDALTLS